MVTATRKTATRKTELTPLEAIVVEEALGSEARRDAREGTLARIQELTKERQALYRKAAARPMLAPLHAPRVRAISAEIERLWEQLRRERAGRRAQIERALNVIIDEEEPEPPQQPGSTDAA